jgi:hypothetical protein
MHTRAGPPTNVTKPRACCLVRRRRGPCPVGLERPRATHKKSRKPASSPTPHPLLSSLAAAASTAAGWASARYLRIPWPNPGSLLRRCLTLCGERFEDGKIGFSLTFSPRGDSFLWFGVRLQVTEDAHELPGLDLVPPRVVAAVGEALRALRDRRRRHRGRCSWYFPYLLSTWRLFLRT